MLSGGQEIKGGFLEEAALALSLSNELVSGKQNCGCSSEYRRVAMRSHRDGGRGGVILGHSLLLEHENVRAERLRREKVEGVRRQRQGVAVSRVRV